MEVLPPGRSHRRSWSWRRSSLRRSPSSQRTSSLSSLSRLRNSSIERYPSMRRNHKDGPGIQRRRSIPKKVKSQNFHHKKHWKVFSDGDWADGLPCHKQWSPLAGLSVEANIVKEAQKLIHFMRFMQTRFMCWPDCEAKISEHFLLSSSHCHSLPLPTPASLPPPSHVGLPSELTQIAAAAETEFVNVPSSAGERPEYYVGGGHRQCTRWTLRIRIRGKRFPRYLLPHYWASLRPLACRILGIRVHCLPYPRPYLSDQLTASSQFVPSWTDDVASCAMCMRGTLNPLTSFAFTQKFGLPRPRRVAAQLGKGVRRVESLFAQQYKMLTHRGEVAHLLVNLCSSFYLRKISFGKPWKLYLMDDCEFHICSSDIFYLYL